MSTSPPRIRRTASNASSPASIPRTPSRTLSSASTGSSRIRSSPGERPASLLASPISLKGSPMPPSPVLPTSAPHVVPQEQDEISPRLSSNPFEGRLFEGLSPALGRESHEFLDEVSFRSPDMNAGRGVRSARFQDHDDEEEDQSDSDKSGPASPRKKYTSLQLAEDHGEDEDDVFLDEKRKPQSSNNKFSSLKKFIPKISPKLSKKLRDFYNKHPKSTKWSFFALASLIPLFLIAFIILVIITEVAYQSPTVFSTNLLSTSALEAGIWGFNFTRAVNLTMINTSKMTVNFETIVVDINLARVPANFKGNGSTVLDITLGPNGDYTTFLLPMKFAYDFQADMNGDTLEVLLNGCGLVEGSSASGITFDMNVSGDSKVFGMFGKGWSDTAVGGIMECDKFLKDAVRIMGQLRGTQLSGK